MPYDPSKPPWQQNYSAPGQQPPASHGTDPVYDTNRAPWDQKYVAPQSSPGSDILTTDPFIRDLQNPDLPGTAARFAGGAFQGYADPVEKLGERFNINAPTAPLAKRRLTIAVSSARG